MPHLKQHSTKIYGQLDESPREEVQAWNSITPFLILGQILRPSPNSKQ